MSNTSILFIIPGIGFHISDNHLPRIFLKEDVKSRMIDTQFLIVVLQAKVAW